VPDKPVSAIDGNGLADGRVGAGGNRIRIRPILVLRLFGKRRHQPLMGDGQAEHPAGRSAAPRHRRCHLDHRIKSIFVAAIDRRLHHPEKSRVAQPRDDLGRHLPVRFRAFCAFSNQASDAGCPCHQFGDARPWRGGLHAEDCHGNDSQSMFR
jgi:hypothetical protein